MLLGSVSWYFFIKFGIFSYYVLTFFFLPYLTLFSLSTQITDMWSRVILPYWSLRNYFSSISLFFRLIISIDLSFRLLTLLLSELKRIWWNFHFSSDHFQLYNLYLVLFLSSFNFSSLWDSPSVHLLRRHFPLSPWMLVSHLNASHVNEEFKNSQCSGWVRAAVTPSTPQIVCLFSLRACSGRSLVRPR